jgi:hypothetical protein
MNYEITEDQYRKIVLNFLNNMVGELNVEEMAGTNSTEIYTDDGYYYATLWIKTKNNPLPGGCKTILSLSHNFMGMFAELIPVMIPELFSKILLEYFTQKTGIEPQCIDFSYQTGEINDNGRPKVKFFVLNKKKR